jgi:hypothetical protein
MAYILNKTDGTPLVTIPNKTTTGTDYSVTFIGKDTLSYGEALNESLLHLMENSASDSGKRPLTPVLGQTWYNKTDKTLYVCYQEKVGTTPARFQALAKSNSGSGVPSNPSTGDLWYDSGNLKIYAGPPRGWITVGPQVQADWVQSDINQIDYIKNKPAGFAPELRVLFGNNVITDKITRNINFTGPGVAVNLVNGTTDSVVVNITGSGTGGGAAAITVGAAAPPNPDIGTLWYENTTILRGFIFNGFEWVDFSPAGGGTTTTAPSNPSVAASTSFVLATKNGATKGMGVVLSPGTWQLILDTRIGINAGYGGTFRATQTATIQAGTTVTTTVATEVRAYVNSNSAAASGATIFQSLKPTAGSPPAAIAAFDDNINVLNSTSDIAVAEIVISVDTAVIISMQGVVVSDSKMLTPLGSTLTLTKIVATDAQKIYSGTMPTFTVPPAAGIGVGQTWRNMKNNREVNKDYPNSASAPIMVAIGIELINGFSELFVNSISMGTVGNTTGGSGQLSAIVPAGGTYRVTGPNGCIRTWAELS